MTGPRRRNRAFGRNRLGVAILSMVALATMVAAGVQFMRLLDNERAMDAIVREDAMWAVFQSDRHLRDFEHQLNLILETGNPAYHPRMMRSFDILYSRIRLLERGTFVLDLNAVGRLSELARDLRESVVAKAGQMDALRPDDPAYLSGLARIAVDLPRLQQVSNELVLAANVETNDARVRDRAERAAIQDSLIVLALLAVLAFSGIFALLMLQLRRIGRVNRHMALLQQRSERRALRAKAASKAKSAFLATMSHEIRTPLNGIIGSTELLALASLSGDQADRIATIRASAFLLRDIIDGILDFSQLEAGGITPRLADIDLQDMAGLLRQAFADQADRAGLTLDIRLPAQRVQTHDVRLRQVLINLIGNALKFTPQGRVQVRGQLLPGDMLRFEVEDDGIGIAPQDQTLLFLEFRQIDGSMSRQYGGTGLGLAICKRVVEGLGGRIGVESTPGKGSLFWFTMPAVPLPDSPTPASVPDQPATVRPLHILVAEDNAVNLRVVTGLAEHLGHRVTGAPNGQVCLDLVAADPPDVIFMDMQMPLMDGVQATRALRARGVRLPVIGVTANALPEDRRACLEAGMDDFLPKPLTVDAIARALDRIAGKLAPDAAPDGPAPPPAILGNPQLEELASALGPRIAETLLAQFAVEIDETAAALHEALSADTSPDEILHRFKGAALTLGLMRTANQAQALRAPETIDSASLQNLIHLARADVAQAQHQLRSVPVP